MILSIDFDGTLVEHRFPAIGREVPEAFRWLRAFQDAGVRLILWTMRSDGPEGPALTEAVAFCKERGIEFWSVNSNPDQAEWTSSPKCYAHHYIGDDAIGCPLQESKEMGQRPMADWSIIGPMVMGVIDAKKKDDGVSLSAAEEETPAAANRLTSAVIQRVEAGTSAISAEVLREAVAAMRRLTKASTDPRRLMADFLREFRAILRRYEPVLAHTASDSQLAAWLEGGIGVALGIPDLQAEETPPTWELPAWPSGADPIVTFPALDGAYQELAARHVLTADEYFAQANQASVNGFTVARAASLDALERVRDTLAEAVVDDEDVQAFHIRLEEGFAKSRMAPRRQGLVLRDAVMREYARGQRAVVETPLVYSHVPFVLRAEIADSRLTPLCEELSRCGIEGTGIYCVEDPVWRLVAPPSHRNCFVPDTEVQGRFSRGFRYRYDGQVIEISTRSGKGLTVTPNHPVLTPDGFAAAGSLCQGDNLLSYAGGIKNRLDANWRVERPILSSADDAGLAFIDEYEHYAPATIDQVFRAIEKSFRSPIWRSPRRPNDFHGDARFGNGDIEIVGSDRPLLLDDESLMSQRGNDFTLASMNIPQAKVSRFGSLLQHFLGIRPSSRHVPRSRTLSLNGAPALFERCPLQFLCFGPAANLNASRYEANVQAVTIDAAFSAETEERFAGNVAASQLVNSIDDNSRWGGHESVHLAHRSQANASATKDASESGSAGASLARQLVKRFAGVVAIDEIVKIRYHQFRGHVYDLQSPQGWILSNGIFTSNCRCGAVYLTIARAAARGLKIAQKWLATGIRPPDSELFVPVPAVVFPPGWKSPWAA